MDPSVKLINCFYFYSQDNNINIEKTVNKCIEEGAILNKEHYSELYIPIYLAMYLNCNIDVINILKDAWWDNLYFYEQADDCQYCNEHDTYIIKYYIDVFLNDLYNNELKHNITITSDRIKKLHEYAKLFNIKLLDYSDERHKLIYSHAYKYVEE